jgi:ATP-dependent Lon protease
MITIKKHIKMDKLKDNKTNLNKKNIETIDDNDTPTNKLDIEFLNKCYMYGLPYNNNDEYNNNKISIEDKTKITKIYNKIKKNLILKSINILDILNINNMTIKEKTVLIEKYSILQLLDGDLFEYIKYRDVLKSEIEYYTNRTIDYNTILYYESKKKELLNININNFKIEEQIINLDIDDYTMSIIYQKYNKLILMNNTDSEYYKLKEWIEIVIKIPYNIIKPIQLNNNIKNILIDVKNKLDKELYGMQDIKEELLLILNHRLINPNAGDHSIALIGPPGVGKTKIILTLASILNIPFEQISLGNINDSSYLNGHSYTYEGAKSGKIVESFIKLGCKNGILFFDEVDKIGNTVKSQEVSNQLLHITDFTQNSKFTDKYISELPIDLSKIWFIFSLNDENLMDPILKNRMNLIKVPGYTINDKIEILNRFLIPQITKSLNMNSNNIIINNNIKKFIVETFSKEEGIRDLKRVIETLYRKLDVLCKLINDNTDMNEIVLSFKINNFNVPHSLTIQDIHLLLKSYIKENSFKYNLYI